MTETNVELARRGYEAVLRHDMVAVRAFLHPDVTWHGGDPSAQGACQNREQAIVVMSRSVARGALGELVDIVDAGDRVVVIMRARARRGEPGVLTANLTTFRDGKAIEMVHFPHPADALAAAGVRPSD